MYVIVKWINYPSSVFKKSFSKLEDAYLQLTKVLNVEQNKKVFLQYYDSLGNLIREVQYR